MADPRTFKLDRPLMEGDDIKTWQKEIKEQFQKWGINYPVGVDGVYGVGSRSATAALLYALGISRERMREGVTPWLRTKVRDRRLSVAERARFARRVNYRRRLRKRFGRVPRASVAPPLNRILQSSWGFQPGHDGVDLICDEDAPGFAICPGVILRADAGGWWGMGAPRDPQLKAKGDGIVILECTVDVGPFRKGMHFGYGHAEKPRVRVGDTVKAGEHICNAGMANAWHFHFMANKGEFGTRGKGSLDPMIYVNYAIKNGK